jgi:hypothetical protein
MRVEGRLVDHDRGPVEHPLREQRGGFITARICGGIPVLSNSIGNLHTRPLQDKWSRSVHGLGRTSENYTGRLHKVYC